MTKPILVDGALGEGGGQVLRSALTLSLLTGQPCHLSRIRAGRERPGLRPQHLAAVQAAVQISGARVSGDRVGAQEIRFEPGPVRPGEYRFDIGTAGATALVLQTILLPLALAAGPSLVEIRGGTHVPRSPCFHYLAWQWRPLLGRIGIPFDLTLTMAGFYPQGGGELRARIPGGARPGPLRLTERGALLTIRGLSAVANLPREIAERQRSQALRRLRAIAPQVLPELEVEELPASTQGTVLLLLATCEQGQGCCFALGARGLRAEQVADEAVEALAGYLRSDGAVDPWLADQILLPLALAGEASSLRTSAVTRHLLTNAEVIRLFLPVEIHVDGALGGPATIQVRPGPGSATEEEPFLRVECYAGHRAETEPRRLHLGHREVAVIEIIDRWLDPEHRYFKLRGDDGGIYLVRHDTQSERWELTLFDSGHRDETRLSST